MITIIKVFTDYEMARRAVQELEARGIPSADISLIANEHVSDLHDDVEETSSSATGAGVGAVVGGTAGLLTGLGLLAIPGLGPVVAAGWLVTTALGAVAGGATGGLLGALVGAGVPEEHAHVYSEAVRRGGALLSVKTADANEVTVNTVVNRHLPIDPDLQGEEYRSSGWSTFDPAAAPYTPDQTRREANRRPGL